VRPSLYTILLPLTFLARAYNRKHGHHAWLKRHNLQADRRAEAEEHRQEVCARKEGRVSHSDSDSFGFGF
jgi:hypothetical protein